MNKKKLIRIYRSGTVGGSEKKEKLSPTANAFFIGIMIGIIIYSIVANTWGDF